MRDIGIIHNCRVCARPIPCKLLDNAVDLLGLAGKSELGVVDVADRERQGGAHGNGCVRRC